jgi:hypothetical protein
MKDLDIDGKIELKYVCKKCDSGMGWVHLGQDKDSDGLLGTFSFHEILKISSPAEGLSTC